MSPWSTAGPQLHRTTGTAHRLPSDTPCALLTGSPAAGCPASLIRLPIWPWLARFDRDSNGKGVHRRYLPALRGDQMSVFGGPDPGPEDELGGPDRGPENELGTDAGPEDELGGPDPAGQRDDLGGPDPAGQEDELRTQD